MGDPVRTFYDDLAESYHLIFQDWTHSIQWQTGVLGPLIEHELPTASLRILDCACGIGTQALGLAQRGHTLVGADLSPAAICRARREAEQRRLPPVHRPSVHHSRDSRGLDLPSLRIGLPRRAARGAHGSAAPCGLRQRALADAGRDRFLSTLGARPHGPNALTTHRLPPARTRRDCYHEALARKRKTPQ